jgi:hypothetical protein
LTTLFAVALGLAVAGGLTSGCDPNAFDPLLTPTGGGSGCTSGFTTIQMVGDFTTPGFSIPDSPRMTLARVDGKCVWQVTVTLNAGTVLFKFVTNGRFDDPMDYGGSEAVTLAVPGGPHPTLLVSGTGTAIRVSVATTGNYTFTLDEEALTWTAEAAAPPPGGSIAGTVAFANLSTAPYPTARVEAFSGATSVAATTTDPTTRAFLLPGLAAGTYRLVVSASCFTTTELASVTVAGGVNDIGPIALAEGASSSTTINLVGGFNVFNPTADPMIESPPCVWTRERFVNAGVYPMKFFIDGQAEPSYGGDDTVQIPVPGGGVVQRFETGGTAIQISVATSGVYRFVLDERLQRWDATLVTPSPATEEGP